MFIAAPRLLQRRVGPARLAGCTTAAASLWTVQPRRCSTAASGKGNFFDFLHVARHPDIDVAALQKTYHNLQRRVHPDQQQVQVRELERRQQRRTAAADASPTVAASPTPCVPDAAGAAVDVSTYANAAYEALRTPYARCRYLSRLVKAEEVKGGPLTAAEAEELMVEDDRRTMATREARPDAPMSQEFLMEMMSASELIFGGDGADEDVRRQWAVLRHDLEDRAKGYFTSAIASWDAQDTRAFHQTVLEWTYVNNALQNLRERMLE
ncbi:DnaJ domain/HSCB C-terminal oligomerization domain containing protein [Novymonas esmeraldas]|uniref:DnaJ domain/HSCB C-terminal oligomerization domain containing protein n=1 Tax=Novymonas esmeraldas TaxID=1808958 RepID=A0AAW0ENZ7_9TRYP